MPFQVELDRLRQRRITQQFLGMRKLRCRRFDGHAHRVEQLPGAEISGAIRAGKRQHVRIHIAKTCCDRLRFVSGFLKCGGRGSLPDTILPIRQRVRIAPCDGVQ